MTLYENEDTQLVNPLSPIPGAIKSDSKRATQILEPGQAFDIQPRLTEATRVVIDLRRMVLRLLNTGESIQVNVSQKALIGRSDPGMIEKPEVDLSNYSGYRMGVSRRHALLIQTDDGRLMITDLGSSNGTFVNDVRLMPHVAYPLHDYDFLRLGKIIMQVDAKMAYRRESLDQSSARRKDAKAQ